MTSKFQKVAGAVKDQTSISLALLALRGTSTTLEVAVIKATSHDEVPANDRYATEVLLLASSSPSSAAAAAAALRRRIARSSNWVVALKTLTVIYTTILDAGPDFRREAALHRLLDLSSFRSFPWDFTAFVRTYALYLDARLQSSLQGYISLRCRRSPPTDLKPAILLDKIQHWQRLLDRAVGTRPTGPAKTNRLVHISLCSVIRESFDLYHEVAEGISLLLDNFFQLPYPACVTTVEACRKTARLFEDLEQFYEVCKEIGIGRASEYPTVQKVSRKLLDRLNEFLKERLDSSNVEATSARANKSPWKLLGPPPAEYVADTVVERSRGRGASLDEGRRMLVTESLSPSPSIRRTTTAKSFNDGAKPALAIRSAIRSASARVEEKGEQKNSFEKSAWIQNKLGESERQQLVKEQQLWLQHQNTIIERNLALL